MSFISAVTGPRFRPGASAGSAEPRGAAPGLWTVLAAVYATGLVLWIASGQGVSSELGKAVLNLGFQPLNLAAAAAFWRASEHAAPAARLRLALRLFAAGYLCVFAGNTVWFFQESLQKVDPTFSWPNVPYLLSYVIGIAGLLALPVSRRSRFEWWKFLIDATLTALGGVTIVWFVVIRPLTTLDLAPLHRGILLAFPFGALIFFVGLLTVLLRRPSAVSMAALRLYVIGQGMTLVGDLFYQLVYQNPSYAGVQWTYTLYAVSYVIIVWSGQVFARGAPAEPLAASTDEMHVWSPLPWIAAGAVYVLLLWNAIQTWTSSLSGLVVVALVLTVLLIVREVATVRQNARLLHARALRDSDTRFESLVRHSSDPLLIVDAGLLVRFASPAAARALARPTDALLGTRLLDLLHPDDVAAAAALFRETIPHADITGPIRWRMRQPGGSWRHLEAVVTNLLADPGVKGLVITAHDVTERDSLEEQLRHAQKMEAIGQLAGGVAHDFNNLLTTILGAAELAAERLPSGSTLRSDIEEIRAAGRRAAALTGQLLAFSRKHVIEAKVLDVSELVAGTHRLMQRLIGEHINLVVRVERDVGCIRGDAAQVEQALVNLIVNGRDAIADTGTITLEALRVESPSESEPELAGLRPGPYVALRVTDTGAGMDPATQARVFEPFYTTKALGRGTGLGLATVYGMVQRHGGAITLRSAIGQGSRFTIYLPRVDQPAGTTARERPPEPDAGQETILVVEDEVAVLRTVARGLRSRGYTVLEAAEGDTAVALAKTHPGAIDLVIMDVILPGRSGPQIMAELQQIRPGALVLYASGYTGRELTPHGLLASEVAFLQKPYSIAELTSRVRQLLSAVPAPSD